MNEKQTRKRLQDLSDSGDDTAKFFLALIKGVTPEMQKIFLEQAAAGFKFADTVVENSKNPEFLHELERRSKGRG